MRAWLSHNLHSLKIALDRFRAAPLAALFTVMVIGVALSLPAGLYLVLTNLKQVAGGIQTDTEITLFLKTGAEAEAARTLAQTLRKRDDVRSVRFIHRQQGLQRLEEAGLGDITAGLPDNPLPHALLITPRDPSPRALERLSAELKALPDVDQINLDTDWAKRLAGMMRLGREAIGLLALLLGFALTAITGNTIRLQIYAQRDEIEVARLIGATDRFIRRPFLYFGAIQGLAGGVAAWGLITLSAWAIQGSVSHLAASYGTHYLVTGLTWQEAGALLATSTLLGLVGAYFAVGHTMRSLNIP